MLDDGSSSGEQGVDVREVDVSYLGHPSPPLAYSSLVARILLDWDFAPAQRIDVRRAVSMPFSYFPILYRPPPRDINKLFVVRHVNAHTK